MTEYKEDVNTHILFHDEDYDYTNCDADCHPKHIERCELTGFWCRINGDDDTDCRNCIVPILLKDKAEEYIKEKMK